MIETVRELAQLQTKVDNQVNPEISVDLISPFLALPGLVGFWPMSSVQLSTGDAYDISAQARILTYNGNPQYNYSGVAPYIALDGTDFLSRLDEADMSIQGNEAIYANPGLTFGGWFWLSALPAANVGFISKYVSAGNQRSYAIIKNATNFLDMDISVNGTAVFTTVSTDALLINKWYYLVGRLTPQTEGAVFINNKKFTNTTSVPASIFNSNATFVIGAHQGGTTNFLTGRASSCFLCATVLSDGIISKVFESTRGAFGV